jgi:hypothetical protein
MASKSGTRKVLISGVVTSVVLVIATVILVPDARVTIARPLWSDACLTEVLKTIPDLSGMKFEITYENCDTLAKEEAVTVYVSKAVAGNSLFSRWSNRKTPIFCYDPARYDNPPPLVQASGKDKILISIAEVSSVSLQRHKWRDISIDYSSGHIYYP